MCEQKPFPVWFLCRHKSYPVCCNMGLILTWTSLIWSVTLCQCQSTTNRPIRTYSVNSIHTEKRGRSLDEDIKSYKGCINLNVYSGENPFLFKNDLLFLTKQGNAIKTLRFISYLQGILFSSVQLLGLFRKSHNKAKSEDEKTSMTPTDDWWPDVAKHHLSWLNKLGKLYYRLCRSLQNLAWWMCLTKRLFSKQRTSLLPNALIMVKQRVN